MVSLDNVLQRNPQKLKDAKLITTIAISGACGKMGTVVADTISKRENCRVVAGIDRKVNLNANFPIFNSTKDINVDFDVIIDFSNPALTEKVLEFAENKKIPIVICTTGFSSEQIDRLYSASKKIPVFFSGNMSLGINLLIELSKKAASVLSDSFDIEIIEKHHNQKIDSPSGTALMIADAIKEVCSNKMTYIYDRHGYRKKRSKNEIGIHSIRGGTIVGEHEIIFAGNNEIVTISHSAQSKEVFAIGAINAALYLSQKAAGMYNMSDLIK